MLRDTAIVAVFLAFLLVSIRLLRPRSAGAAPLKPLDRV